MRGVGIPFDVVSNPEFLREGTAVHDFTHPNRVVIGSENEKASRIMKDVYRALFLNETPYIETNIESAELTRKLFGGLNLSNNLLFLQKANTMQ